MRNLNNLIKEEKDSFKDIKEKACAVGLTVLIMATGSTLYNSSNDIYNSLKTAYHRFNQLEVKYYDVNAGINRMDKALEIQKNNPELTLEEAYVQAGDKKW